MTTFDNLTSAQRVRATLHREARAVCAETCHLLGLGLARPAAEVVAELLYKKLAVYGTDLEAFAKHAKRSTINADDVKLLARRNPSLKTHLNTIAPPITTAPKKRQKTAIFKQTDTPAKTIDTTSATKDNTRKEDEKQNGRPPEDIVENMVVDTTVDLTFE